MNLIEEIQSELKRVKEILPLYEAIPTGAFGAMMIKSDIKAGEESIASGDTVKMVSALANLQSIKS